MTTLMPRPEATSVPRGRAFSAAAALLAVLLLASCAPKTVALLEQGLQEGKSVVIFPYVDNVTIWTLEGDDATPYFTDSRSSGGKYAVVALPPGTYHIRGFARRALNDGSLRMGMEREESRFGSARVEQTPWRKYEMRRGSPYPLLMGRWRDDFYGDDVLYIRSLQSYYLSSYDLVRDGGFAPGALGTLTVGPGETLLVPGIRLEARLAGKACTLAGRDGDFYFPGIYRKAFWGPINPDDSFYTYTMECPVQELIVDIFSPSMADMLGSVDGKDFPPGVLERATERSFEPGTLFAEPHQTVTSSGGERHVFSGGPGGSDKQEP